MELKVSPFFRDSYKKFIKKNPKIDKKLEEFFDRKTKIPPERMPREHVLDGRLKGIKECHLAPNILLLWQEKGDVVNQLLICDHDDIKGAKEAALSKKLKPHL